MPRLGSCDLNSKAAAFRLGEEIRTLLSDKVEKFDDGTVCTQGTGGVLYTCKRESGTGSSG